MPTITGGKYIHYNNKRFFTMSTAIAVDGSTNAPAEAVQGSIGVTTHNTGKSYWFVSNGTKWIANGGAVSSTAFADITGVAGDNASLATALGLLAPKANPAFTGNPTAPTQTAGNNSTRLANTAFVAAAVAAGGGSSNVQTAILMADFSMESDTPVAVPDLTVNVVAGHTYTCTFYSRLHFSGFFAQPLVGFDGGTVGAPADPVTGITGIFWALSESETTAAGDMLRGDEMTSLVNGCLYFYNGSGAQTAVSSSFTLIANATGTMAVTLAQDVAAEGHPVTLKKLATLRLEDVTS